MRFALVVDGAIRSVGGTPSGASRLDTGDWVAPDDGAAWDADALAACGYFPVVEVDPPALDPGTTCDPLVCLVDSVPIVVWTVRPFTPDEVAAQVAAATAATADANRTTITTALANALTALQTTIDATDAAINANPAPYVRSQARILKRVVRLLTNALDSAG